MLTIQNVYTGKFWDGKEFAADIPSAPYAGNVDTIAVRKLLKNYGLAVLRLTNIDGAMWLENVAAGL